MLPALTSRRVLGIGREIGGLLGRVGLRPGGDLEVLGRGFESLDNAGSRQAFLHTVRAVIEPGGQRVSANNRLALAAALPTLIVWGERDSIIPVEHGVAAHEAMPEQPFVVFDRAGHMPHDDDPYRFAKVLIDFCDTTEPARLTADHWQPLLGAGRERRAPLRPRRLLPRRREPRRRRCTSAGSPSTTRRRTARARPSTSSSRISPGGSARAPRYRQRLAGVPFGLHEPVWVDDPDFDPAEHLLPADGSDLGAIVDAVLSTPLARDRPLWEMWIADSLPGGRIGVVGKAHHCMVDGTAVVELGKLLLDAEPASRSRPRRSRLDAPAPAPSAAERLARAVVDRAADTASLALTPVRLAARPRAAPAPRAPRHPHALAHAAPARARLAAQPRRARRAATTSASRARSASCARSASASASAPTTWCSPPARARCAASPSAAARRRSG